MGWGCSSGECVVRQLCSCRSQFTPWLGWVNTTLLLPRSSLKMAVHLYWRSVPLASASNSVDVIQLLIKKNSQLGVELQTSRFCIKKQISWPTSYRNRTRNCGRCESFHWTISTAFWKETRGCSMAIWSKLSENSASRSQDAPLPNCDCTRTEWKKLWNPYNFVSRTFRVQLFCCLRTTHISTFQAQSANKISGTGLTSNPPELHQRPLHSPKVCVCCAIFELVVWGPYLFLRGRCYCNGDIRSVLCNARELSPA
jgi:hypothetical protein